MTRGWGKSFPFDACLGAPINHHRRSSFRGMRPSSSYSSRSKHFVVNEDVWKIWKKMPRRIWWLDFQFQCHCSSYIKNKWTPSWMPVQTSVVHGPHKSVASHSGADLNKGSHLQLNHSINHPICLPKAIAFPSPFSFHLFISGHFTQETGHYSFSNSATSIKSLSPPAYQIGAVSGVILMIPDTLRVILYKHRRQDIGWKI